MWSCSAVIAAGLLVGSALPTVAQSQINGRVVSAPQVGTVSHAAQSSRPKLPKAPAQVAMPTPPPIKIFPGLEEPLVATGPVTEEEGQALDIVLNEFHDAPLKAGPQGDFDDYARPLILFIESHPKSNWNAALYTDLGLGYYHAGYYSRAFSFFETAWKLGRDANTPQARLMIDRAVGELAKMHARVGHEKELNAVFADIGKRPIGGPATELIQGAREGLWSFRHDPGVAYLCGPKALENVLKTLNASPKQIKVAQDARSGPHGFSLTQLAALADKAHLKYTLIHREAGQPIPVPSIIHWKVNHYAAVVGMQDGKYVLKDPTFADAGAVLTQKAIDAESSGYFLVPARGGLPSKAKGAGWRTVSAKSTEANSVYGMGGTTNNLGSATAGGDCSISCSCSTPAGNQSTCSGTPSSSDTAPPPQMTVANAHKMVVSLHLSDTPVGYKPQKGSPVFSFITYNQREAEQPATFAFSNVSPKWSFSWMSYMQDDPVNLGSNVMRVTPGGGGYQFPNSYNTSCGCWPVETPDASGMYRIPTSGALTRYEHRLPDGTIERFTLSDGATSFPRKVFLTSITDPQGNVTTLNYDASFRLTSVVDAMGRSTTFTYGIPTSPLLITQITDPFGRAAQMTYDTSGRLASITDPVGITSSFTYSASEPTFVTSLTTPYGTSTFSDTVNPNDTPESNTRSLTLTDPLGFTDYLYYYQNTAVTPATESPVPSGLPFTDNGLLNIRNLFEWDKHAFSQGVTMAGGVVQSEDFSKSTITHWLHDNTINSGWTGRAIASVKKPLERRLWFVNNGQPNSIQGGSLDRPAYVARVLDDGTTQKAIYTYSAAGVYGGVTDPKGRLTQYVFAANAIDPTLIRQNTSNPPNGATWANIASFTWNTQHEPLTYTDAAGKIWTFTYNASGQLATVKDPNSKITTNNYDASGRLSSITNANNVTQASYTYDSADRIQTYTDSEGYVLTYAYDNLDRVTSITYPDGTTDLYDYSFQSGPFAGTQSLELRRHTDRLGRVTTYGFDADRRLTSVTEPTSGTGTRTTSYSYYEDGTLKEITDANGNVTHWDIDLQSRPIDKTYAFGTSAAQTETYTYETTTSRLHSITDALGQVKTFTYDIDDRVKGITYTNTVNPTPNITFTWSTTFPRLTSMTDGLGTTNFAYVSPGTNGALKLASVTGPFGANGNLSLTYDALGRLATRTIAGGNETFGYDAINRLTSHSTPLGTFTNTYLGQTDQTTARSVTNGTVTVSTNWNYDTNVNDRRLIGITNSGVTRSYTLGYGSPVNPYDIMSITDTAATGHPFASQSHNYGYDLIDRLTSATSTTPGNYSYAYDNLDNATAVTDPAVGSITPTYNGLNQVQTFNTNTYSYDANGNTSSDGVTKDYKWDAENRLIEIDYIGTTAKSQFSYDALGRRTVDVETDNVGNVTTKRLLWCASRVCQTRDGSDTVQNRVLDEGEFNAVTAQKAVYMPDATGAVRDVIDATSGNLLSSIDYSPYGNPVQTNGAFIPFYQYAELARHVPSNMNFAVYRTQDGAIGRFLNLDPIREADGANLYVYVEDSPFTWTDPEGLAKSGQTTEIPGTNKTVRIDPPHVPGQQVHAHVCEKGCKDIVINVDGTASHGSDIAKLKNKKVLKYLAKRGFRVALKCAAPAFFLYDWYDGGFGHAVDEATWPIPQLME
jgi:RHS repeat-associated protein